MIKIQNLNLGKVFDVDAAAVTGKAAPIFLSFYYAGETIK